MLFQKLHRTLMGEVGSNCARVPGLVAVACC